jgi:hypothetical protein
VTLTRDARRLLVAASRLALSEVFTWQCGLYPDADALRELERAGLIKTTFDHKSKRTWFRVTDSGLSVAMTPEPAAFRTVQQGPKALTGGGKP